MYKYMDLWALYAISCNYSVNNKYQLGENESFYTKLQKRVAVHYRHEKGLTCVCYHVNVRMT
jgi:hypothetical protein